MYKEIIGKNLKYLRDKKNVTQILAEEMTGIDRTTISAYELAKREPSVSNLISLANYYKVTLDFLCGRNQRMIIDITDLDELSKNKIMSILRWRRCREAPSPARPFSGRCPGCRPAPGYPFPRIPAAAFPAVHPSSGRRRP